MTKEWVTENCCVGFCTDKGLMLDLDNATFRNAKRIAEDLLNPHSLEDYLFIPTCICIQFRDHFFFYGCIQKGGFE